MQQSVVALERPNKALTLRNKASTSPYWWSVSKGIRGRGKQAGSTDRDERGMVQRAGLTPPVTLALGSWAHLVACSQRSCLVLLSERKQRLCWTEPQSNLTSDPNPHYNPFLQSQLTQSSPRSPPFFLHGGTHYIIPTMPFSCE